METTIQSFSASIVKRGQCRDIQIPLTIRDYMIHPLQAPHKTLLNKSCRGGGWFNSYSYEFLESKCYQINWGTCFRAHTKQSEPVVYGDNHHSFSQKEVKARGAVVAWAADEGATMYPDQHGQKLAATTTRRLIQTNIKVLIIIYTHLRNADSLFLIQVWAENIYRRSVDEFSFY